MAVSETLLTAAPDETAALHEVVVKNLEQFCAECDRFIQWQYREIIRGQPSAEQQERHRHQLQWALRTARLLECVASDPDSATPSALALLRAKIWQLERSWKTLFAPMSEAEADKILAEVFPDEPRT